MIWTDSFPRCSIALALMMNTTSAVADIEFGRPEVKLLVQYAATVGKITACGPLGQDDRTQDLASAIAGKDHPGFWAWLVGTQGDYADELLELASDATMKELSKPCDVAPLQDAYRQILRSIEGALLPD